MKIKLQLEDLAVDSFDTTPVERGKGTVFGAQDPCTCYTCTCPGCPTCAGTCPADPSCADTCWNTCDDWTCVATCGFTNCDTRCGGVTCPRCQEY